MEQLHELHASGQYDLVVVDTPPSRNALDVLDAPGTDEGVLRQPRCCGGSPCRTGRGCSRWRPSRSTKSPIGCSARDSCRTSPSSSCCSRPWRAGSSRGRRRSSGCSRDHAHHVRRRVDARGRARSRGRLSRACARRAGLPARRDHRQPGAPGRVHRQGRGEERPATPHRIRWRGRRADRGRDRISCRRGVEHARRRSVPIPRHLVWRDAKPNGTPRLERLASLLLTAPTLDHDINDLADLFALGEHLRG